MTSPRGGLYWGKPTPEAVKAISAWDTVILNEANWEAIAPQLRGVVRRLGCSFARSVWVDPQGGPSVYWPVQQRIHHAATIFDGWVMSQGKPIETQASPRAWLYDLTSAPFRNELARIIARFVMAERPDILFFDELHTSLVGIPNGDQIRYPALWQQAARQLLLSIGNETGGTCPPVMTNGTFRRVAAPGMVKGHYWQNVGAHDPNAVREDRLYYDGDVDLVLHCCPPLTREASQILADQVRASAWDWHPAPALPFDRVY